MCWIAYFFFFKQKTAYEMRISDWSSDVCSSDLGPSVYRDTVAPGATGLHHVAIIAGDFDAALGHYTAQGFAVGRSEERRVGKSVSVRVDLGGRRIMNKNKSHKSLGARPSSIDSQTLHDTLTLDYSHTITTLL